MGVHQAVTMMQTEVERSAVLEARLRQDSLRRRLPPPSARRAIRQQHGLSAAAVGSYCGVSRQVAAAWERGERNPSGERLERYAELLQRLMQGGSS